MRYNVGDEVMLHHVDGNLEVGDGWTTTTHASNKYLRDRYPDGVKMVIEYVWSDDLTYEVSNNKSGTSLRLYVNVVNVRPIGNKKQLRLEVMV